MSEVPKTLIFTCRRCGKDIDTHCAVLDKNILMEVTGSMGGHNFALKNEQKDPGGWARRAPNRL